MDALAARQLAKKKLAEAKIAEVEKLENKPYAERCKSPSYVSFGSPMLRLLPSNYVLC
jgi:hypothetical protein